MDDDDFNSEFLGAVQRQANLQQNEATRQSIEGLRDDLRRKAQEEEAAPHCPYCAGAISYGAAKCRHCTSDIQWCEVQGILYSLTAEDDAQLFVQQKLHALEQERVEAEQAHAAQMKLQLAYRIHKKRASLHGSIIGSGIGFILSMAVLALFSKNKDFIFDSSMHTWVTLGLFSTVTGLLLGYSIGVALAGRNFKYNP